MADLIIKPSVGNLILKDDQNVTRVSIAPTTGVTTLSNQVFPASQVFPAGHTLQTRFNSNSTAASATTSTKQTAASHTITPLTNSDVLISGTIGGQVDTGGQLPYFEILRGSTQIFQTQFDYGADNGVYVPVLYLDTAPSGNGSTSITYSIKVWIGSGNGTLYLNYLGTYTSTILLQEIAG